MIPDRDKYYGCVLSHLVERWGGDIAIRRMNGKGQGFYLVAETLPVFAKYSKARRGPWTFTFQAEHILEYRDVIADFGECVLTFVCGSDGLAAIDSREFEKLADVQTTDQQSITVRRKLKEMYSLKGRRRTLDRKVGSESLIESVRNILEPI